MADWSSGDCDYNGDGVVDKKDLIEKRMDVFQEFDHWIKECWMPMKKGADINGDSVIDLNDMNEKRMNVLKELIAWM